MGAKEMYRISQTPSGRFVIGLNSNGGEGIWHRCGTSDFDSWHEAERALIRVIRPETRYYDAEGTRIE